MSARKRINGIPDPILKASTGTKCLYLYLAGRGTVSYSSRELARRLGLAQPTVNAAIARMSKAGVIEYKERPRKRVRPTFRVLTYEEVRQMKAKKKPESP